MEIITLFIIAGLVIFIGFLVEWIFEKTNVPDVIWLILLGFILNHYFDILGDSAFQGIAPLFSTFTLIFILFDGALNIDLKNLLKGVGEGGKMALVYFLLCLILITGAMMAAGWGFAPSLLLGVILGGISSDLIIPLVKKVSIKKETAVNLTLESAISDVFSIIGTVTIVNIFVLEAFSVDFMIKRLIYSFGIAIFLGTVVGIIWIRLQKLMDRFSKSYMTTLAAVLLLYSGVEHLESNGAIACLTFGIVLGNSRKIFSVLDKRKEYTLDDSERFFFSQISFFVKTFFFVYLGMLIEFQSPWLIILGLLLTLLLLFIRPLAFAITYRKQNLSGKDRSFMEMMAPKGLAAAVLAQLPMKYGLVQGEAFSQLITYVIMFSIMITALSVFMVQKYDFKGIGHYLDLRRASKKVPKIEEVKKD